MKILAPVSSVREAEVLTSQGAEELYCGINLIKPRKNGSDIWLNRRGPGKANISDLETLNQVVETAHSKGAKVFLTLNQPGYTKDISEEILSVVKETQNAGIDAFIVADPGLIHLLKKKDPDIVIHVSSLASVLNSSSVTFFIKLGVQRIIFPRYLDVKTLENVIWTAGSDIEYEVFVLNDGCVFEEGYCHVSHAFGGAFCHNYSWTYRPLPIDPDGNVKSSENGASLQIKGESFQEHIDEYKRWLWVGIKNFGEITDPKGYPLGMCGVCALPQYKKMGINSLKIVGREVPFKKKVQSVKFVKRVLDFMNEGHTEQQVREYAMKMRGVKGLCESTYMCYDR